MKKGKEKKQTHERGERRGKMYRAFMRVKHAYDVLAAHRYTTIAGTLAFFLITSVVPFLFWLTLIFGQHLPSEQILELELIGWARDFLLFLSENAASATSGAGILFLLTTLWSSTGFFYHLRRSGEIIYKYKRVKTGWKVRLAAFLFTALLLLFFSCAAGLLIAGNYGVRYLSPWIAYPAEYTLLFIVCFFAAWILNAYVCPYRLNASGTVQGSLITAALWLAAAALFAVYLRFSGAEKLYGALSLVIVFLLFLYWMMICFTVGVIYNRERASLRGLEHKTL